MNDKVPYGAESPYNSFCTVPVCSGRLGTLNAQGGGGGEWWGDVAHVACECTAAPQKNTPDGPHAARASCIVTTDNT